MSVYFKLRRVSDYADCSLVTGSTTIDFGFIDRNEAIELLESFKDAIDELEWFINVTDKGEQK